ncbi:MAG: cell division protein FtsZ, partial [Brevundimonas sp.]
TSYAAATRHEPMTAREPAAPSYAREPVQSAAPAPQPKVDTDPIIRQAQPAAAAAPAEPERVIGRIVDPMVDDYEDEASEAGQGDLYFDRRPEPAPARRPVPQPAQPAQYADDSLFENQEPKRGWSLFGRGRRSPTSQSYHQDAPAPAAPQMRPTHQVQPMDEPQQAQADDDLEIPSFLRRLAN